MPLDEGGQRGGPCVHSAGRLVPVPASEAGQAVAVFVVVVVAGPVAALSAGVHTKDAPEHHRQPADEELVAAEQDVAAVAVTVAAVAAADTAAEEERVVAEVASGSEDLADSYNFIIPIVQKLRYALSLLPSRDDLEGCAQ